MPDHPTAEHRRLSDSAARRADWKNWGPYLAERAWGTVREDYQRHGDAWNHFPHDHARSRVYRWNEDGLAGYCNRFQNICLSLALWNEQDPFLKERLFGLANEEGNHGEDVKEYYYYLDGVPSHAFMRMLYKYPQVEYPYRLLYEENRLRGRADPEFELIDALGDALRRRGVILTFSSITPRPAKTTSSAGSRPIIEVRIRPRCISCRSSGFATPGRGVITRRGRCSRPSSRRWFEATTGIWASAVGTSTSIRTCPRCFSPRTRPISSGSSACPMPGRSSRTRFTKRSSAAAPTRSIPAGAGRKRRRTTTRSIAPGGCLAVRTRFSPRPLDNPFGDFDSIVERRIAETDEFYHAIQPAGARPRPAHGFSARRLPGLLWTKQFYHYSVELWLDGDPAGPEPPPARRHGRNAGWQHVYNLDVLSVPDKWEYPWFAAWDTAFHCIVLARLDPEWAKRQVILLLREWYMHPSGQLPAYEWDFSDANPPVHAHAALRVYEIARELTGEADTQFLEEVFHKLLLNFTWWVNRKDPEGRNAFQGGFLGLDNIGVFDRSRPNLGEGRRLEQADGTAWMGMFCLDMLAIALELSQTRPAYEAIATKFFEHFVAISHAINGFDSEIGMWDPVDGFYYDVLRVKGGPPQHLKVRSFVGLIPLFAALAIEPGTLEQLPHFRRRVEWYIRYRSDSGRQPVPDDRARQWRPPFAGACRPGQARSHIAPRLRPGAIPFRLRPAVDVAGLAQRAVLLRRQSRGLRTRRIGLADLRRQFQLARADLVSRQLPDDRGTAGISSLLRLDPDGRAARAGADGTSHWTWRPPRSPIA